MKNKIELKAEIRYAIRLTQRTARLYRRVQTVGIFLAIIGGSATMASIADNIPAWITATGGILLAAAGAMLIAVRPADKAALNEYDGRRYQTLLARSGDMNDAELEQALEETRTGDTPELEPLRAVAYNDIAQEMGRQDAMIALSPIQRLLQSIA